MKDADDPQEESQQVKKRKMTQDIYYISQPLYLKYLYLHCFLIAKKYIYILPMKTIGKGETLELLQ